MDKIESAVIGAFDWGARTACILAALWPRRVKGLVSVSGYLIGSPQANTAPLPPAAELAWWCQIFSPAIAAPPATPPIRARFAS
jgi:pimeloyl-ACP methyl ester carboxylesterase